MPTAAAETASTRDSGPLGRPVAIGLRLLSHALVWTVVVVPAVLELWDGWRPTLDEAMISIGSYRVFSVDSPLNGPWSLASEGMRHAFFDVGPLLFWLLAVPVRVDPNQGALWGAVLACGVALSVAVEAAWSVTGWPGCVGVALATAVVGTQTQVFSDVPWNPYIGLVCLMAALVTAWAVASGRFAWWPLTILFASVAAQCHLIYVLPAAAVALVACPLALLLGYRPSGRRWILASLAVGVVCWSPPVVQQVFGHPPNLSLVLQSGRHPRAGLGFGLHALATATGPRPIWLTRYPYELAFLDRTTGYVDGHSVMWAVGVLLLVFLVAIGAWAVRQRALAALAALSGVLGVATVLTFASLPSDNLSSLSYLLSVLWVVGTLQWFVVGWAVVVLARRAAGALARRGRATLAPARGRVATLVVAIIGGVLVAVAGVTALQQLVPEARAHAAYVRVDGAIADAIATSVERSVPSGPVVVRVDPAIFPPSDGFYSVDYWGAAFRLLADGWHPGLTFGFFGAATHLTVPTGARWPVVTVVMDPRTKKVVAIRVISHPDARRPQSTAHLPQART